MGADRAAAACALACRRPHWHVAFPIHVYARCVRHRMAPL